MKLRDWLLLLSCYAVVGGSLIAHLAVGVYLRSDGYRHRVEGQVAAFFNLPCAIDAVRRMTYSSSAFDGISILLPDREDCVFQCRRAVWMEDRQDGKRSIELDLHDGQLALGTNAWRIEDYRDVLESGVRRELSGLRRVRLDDFGLTLRRRDVLLACGEASGEVDYHTPQVGQVSLLAYVFNGQRVSEPVRIHARFQQRAAALVEHMIVQIPEVALAGLGLTQALGGEVTRGRFSGRLEYRDAEPQPRLALEGRIADLDLAEFTRRLPLGPIGGEAEINLDRAEFLGTLPTLVRGDARLSRVSIADISRLLGWPLSSGAMDLTISRADAAEGVIRELVLSGRAIELELSELLRPLGRGTATGRLAATVNSVRIEGDRIVSADVDILAIPPADGPGVIDRDLLLDTAKDLAGFSLPAALPRDWLPQRIEYTRFGLRLIVSDNRLRVLGRHGEAGDVILTIRALGREWDVLKEWSGQLDLTPWVREGLARVSGYDPRKMREWMRQRGTGGT